MAGIATRPQLTARATVVVLLPVFGGAAGRSRMAGPFPCAAGH